MTPKRWALLKAMAGRGAMAIREVARRLKRDVRAVHSDIQILLKAGILDRTAGRVASCFPTRRFA
jgi:predicted transcriptional regulator